MSRSWVAVALLSFAAAQQCADTPGFDNGSGMKCSDYEAKGWCASGAAAAGAEWTTGEKYQFPEKNCCICGKDSAGSGNAAPTAVTCVDTPGFDNGGGYDCAKYASQNWCADGKVTQGAEWTLGEKYKFPEQNCCICGKGTSAAAQPTQTTQPQAAPAQATPVVLPAGAAAAGATAVTGSGAGSNASVATQTQSVDVGKSEATQAAEEATKTAAGVVDGSCRDTAKWTDLLGHDCKSYTAIADDGRQPCNNGNRQLDVDFFLLFGNHKDAGTALENCCQCGKGTDQGQHDYKKSHPELHYDFVHPDEEKISYAPPEEWEIGTCSDVQLWKDKEGHGCDGYVGTQCKDGKALWPEKMITDYAPKGGESALTACCACGGGAEVKTTEGCQNVAGWQDRNRLTCFAYTDKCAGGMRLAPELDFLASRRNGLSALDSCCSCGGGAERAHEADAHCEDFPVWEDSEGKGCDQYGDLCSNGKPMLEDHSEYESLADAKGESAVDACCMCGGGTATKSGRTGVGMCLDSPDWVDSVNQHCVAYEAFCADGKVTVDGGAEALQKRQNARGVSAVEACCVCGGGEGQIYPEGHPKWIPPPPTPPPSPPAPIAEAPGPWKDTELGAGPIEQGPVTVKAPVDAAPVKVVTPPSSNETQVVYKKLPPPKPVEEGYDCTNLKFEDSEGRTCDSYDQDEKDTPGLDWCIGSTGAVLRPEQEFMKYKAKDGTTAIDSCCACGGGFRNKRNVLKKKKVSSTVKARRENQADWITEQEMKAEAEAKGQVHLAVGTTQFGGPVEEQCVDMHGWTDSMGRDCQDQAYKEMCAHGAPVHTPAAGAAQSQGGTQAGQSREGTQAGQTSSGANGESPEGYPEDLAGTAVERRAVGTVDVRTSFVQREPKLGAAKIIEFANGAGISALDACCNCGGGQEQLEMKNGETVHVPTQGVGMLPPSPGNPNGLVIVEGEKAALFVNVSDGSSKPSGSFVYIPGEGHTMKVAADGTHHVSLNGLKGEIVVKELGSFFRGEGIEDILLAPPAPPEAVASAATRLPPGAGVLPDGTVVMTGAETQVVSDETGTYVMVGDEKVRIGEPGMAESMTGPGGEVKGELVVTPEGTFFQPSTPGAVPFKVGGPAPTHVVLNSNQKNELAAQYQKNIVDARVSRLEFRIDGLKWGDLQMDPSISTNMVNTVEASLENAVGGDATMHVHPANATQKSALLQLKFKPRAALVQHATFPRDNAAMAIASKGGKAEDGVNGEIFLTQCEDWNAVADLELMMRIITTAIKSAMPFYLKMVSISGIGVSSTDKNGPGGLSANIGALVGYSQSEHVDWGAVAAHREKKAEDAKGAPTLQCDDNVWTDNDGRACDEYAGNIWCSWGTVINPHKVQAHTTLYSAADMCCACGGGHFRNPGLPPPFTVHTTMLVPVTVEYKVVDFPTPPEVPKTEAAEAAAAPADAVEAAEAAAVPAKTEEPAAAPAGPANIAVGADGETAPAAQINLPSPADAGGAATAGALSQLKNLRRIVPTQWSHHD